MYREQQLVNPEPPLKGSYDPEQMRSLIADLGSKKIDPCLDAYRGLLEIGEPAVPYLVKALSDPLEKIRWRALRLLDELHLDWISFADEQTIDSLTRELGSKSGFARIRARLALVTIGSRSVNALTQVLWGGVGTPRWEAAKALSQIGDPIATGSLIRALVDKQFEIRWLAAEGLKSIGTAAVEPLLRELIRNPDSVWLREGVHHVLHDSRNKKMSPVLEPVLQALDQLVTPLEVPLVAQSALKALAKKGQR